MVFFREFEKTSIPHHRDREIQRFLKKSTNHGCLALGVPRFSLRSPLSHMLEDAKTRWGGSFHEKIRSQAKWADK